MRGWQEKRASPAVRSGVRQQDHTQGRWREAEVQHRREYCGAGRLVDPIWPVDACSLAPWGRPCRAAWPAHPSETTTGPGAAQPAAAAACARSVIAARPGSASRIRSWHFEGRGVLSVANMGSGCRPIHLFKERADGAPDWRLRGYRAPRGRLALRTGCQALPGRPRWRERHGAESEYAHDHDVAIRLSSRIFSASTHPDCAGATEGLPRRGKDERRLLVGRQGRSSRCFPEASRRRPKAAARSVRSSKAEPFCRN